MKKIPVIYWSGTGNTQIMAQTVAEAINNSGAEALLTEVGQISAAEAAKYPVLALGCPAMGAEVLEEYEFEPFFTELEKFLTGKKVALFGSYGWGGSYMQDWESRVAAAGAELVAPGVLALNAPDAATVEACAEIGRLLAVK